MKKILPAIVLAASSVAAVSPAMAAEVALTSLTSAVSFTEVTTAILAVAGALAGVFVLARGVTMVLNRIKY